MTTIYRVVTKHTKDTIKDFVKFSFRVNNPKTTYRLCVIGVGFFVIAAMLPQISGATYTLLAIGTVICLFALTRHWIGIFKLRKSDLIYRNDWEVEVKFGEKEIRVKNSSEKEWTVKKYGEINVLYMNERNYYVGVSGEDLFILPRDDFSHGNQKKFKEFMERKTNMPMVFLPVLLKNRWKMLRARMKHMEELHDIKLEQKKKTGGQ